MIMKVVKFITHPYTVIICFSLILISGESWGGFYLIYLLFALPHAGIHAVLALIGTILLLISYDRFKRRKIYLMESIINITGIFLLLLSLFFFFYNDKDHYNYQTFYDTVPQVTLVIFSVITLTFLLDNVLVRNKKIKV